MPSKAYQATACGTRRCLLYAMHHMQGLPGYCSCPLLSSLLAYTPYTERHRSVQHLAGMSDTACATLHVAQDVACCMPCATCHGALLEMVLHHMSWSTCKRLGSMLMKEHVDVEARPYTRRLAARRLTHQDKAPHTMHPSCGIQ
jgi:hypothetical protein